MAELANEKLKLGRLFDRVYALAEKKLDSLEKTDPNGNLTKELREVVDLTLRAAKAVGAVTDISVRSEKILGKHMTAERLVAFQQQLQQLLFGAIRTQLVPEQKKALADWMEKNRDKFKPNANIPLLASSASTAMLNPVYLYRDRIKMAFLTGKLMDEHDKNLIRPSADAGDTVVG